MVVAMMALKKSGTSSQMLPGCAHNNHGSVENEPIGSANDILSSYIELQKLLQHKK